MFSNGGEEGEYPTTWMSESPFFYRYKLLNLHILTITSRVASYLRNSSYKAPISIDI